MIWFPLYINDHKIGTVTAIRRSGGGNPDDINMYEWEAYSTNRGNEFTQATGMIEHRYGDGAFELMRKILSKVEEGRFN